MSENKSVNNGKVFSINLSKAKGTSKQPVNYARLIFQFGLEGDAHGGDTVKQVSLLSNESILRQKRCEKVKKKNISLKPGDFAENITTADIDLASLSIGNRLLIGNNVILEISKIGKECHRFCSIYYKTGDCIMPREGIFAQVLCGGEIRVGDRIEVVKDV